MEQAEEKKASHNVWGNRAKTSTPVRSFKELLQEEEEKKMEKKLNETYIQQMAYDDDYLIALRLQEEYDRQAMERKSESETILEPNVDLDEDLALAMQLQAEEDRNYQLSMSKGQVSSKLLLGAAASYEAELPSDLKSSVPIEPEIREHYLGMNSNIPEDVSSADVNAVYIKPTTIDKHNPEHAGKVNISPQFPHRSLNLSHPGFSAPWTRAGISRRSVSTTRL